jgi:hypothetical protein
LDAVAFSHPNHNPDTGSYKKLQIIRRGDRFRITARYSDKLSNPRAATVRIRTLSLCIERNEVLD